MDARNKVGDAGPDRYWYPAGEGETDRARKVLEALRRFHAADRAMRRRIQTDMDLNETDVRALRLLIQAEAAGEGMGPKELGSALGVTSAATAKLLARLVGSAHVRREQHPNDGRAQRLFATPSAHAEVRKTLGAMHARMLAAAKKLDRGEQETVITFLDALSESVGVQNPVTP
jgi:DNA-binding MarR family transcriptional regulator